MEYVIAILQTVFISMLIFYLQRKQNKTDKKTDERANAQKKESLLQLEMSMAGCELSYAVAMAVKRGKPNGEIEEAITAYDKAKKNYYHFIDEQAMEHLIEK